MSTTKWPHDHKAKHAAAARKGWLRRAGGEVGKMTARLSIRRHAYRGRQGYLITGRDTFNRRPSIFTDTKAEAVRIRNAVKRGAEYSFGPRRRG